MNLTWMNGRGFQGTRDRDSKGLGSMQTCETQALGVEDPGTPAVLRSALSWALTATVNNSRAPTEIQPLHSASNAGASNIRPSSLP